VIKKFAAVALWMEDFASVLLYVFHIHNQERIEKKKEREKN